MVRLQVSEIPEPDPQQLQFLRLGCKDCQHWEKFVHPEVTNEGACRRHAPGPLVQQGGGDPADDPLFADWTKTQGHDYCGEFELVPRQEVN